MNQMQHEANQQEVAMNRVRTFWLAFSFALICSGVMLSAKAGTTNESKPDFISLRLVATAKNAGNIGRAILVPQGEKTAINIEISGVPNSTSRPIHLYAYAYDGTCGNRSAAPRYALTDRVLANSLIARPVRLEPIGAFVGPVELRESIPAAFPTFRATRYAISVRTSPADGDAEIFCGDNSH